MRKQNETLLSVMNVLGWVAFVGLLLMAGGYLVSYVISVTNNSATKDIYIKWDLSAVRKFDFGHYTGVVFMRTVIFVMNAIVALMLAKLFSKLKTDNPFTVEMARRIEQIGYMILLTWIAVLIYDGYVEWISRQVVGFDKRHINGEFVLLAGVAFVFAGVIRKGIGLKGNVYTTPQ